MAKSQACGSPSPEIDMQGDVQAAGLENRVEDNTLRQVIHDIAQRLAAQGTAHQAVTMATRLLRGCSHYDVLEIARQQLVPRIMRSMYSMDNDDQRNDGLALVSDILIRVGSAHVIQNCENFIASLFIPLTVPTLRSNAARILGCIAMNSEELKQHILTYPFAKIVINMLPIEDENTRANVAWMIAVVSSHPKRHELMSKTKSNKSRLALAYLHMLEQDIHLHKIDTTEAVLGTLMNLWRGISGSKKVSHCLAACTILDRFLQQDDSDRSKANLVEGLSFLPNILTLLENVGDACPARALRVITTLAGCGTSVLSELLRNDVWTKLLSCPKPTEEAVEQTCAAAFALLEHGAGRVQPPPGELLDWVGTLLDSRVHNAPVLKAACSLLIKVSQTTRAGEKLWSRAAQVIGEMLADTEDREETCRLFKQFMHCTRAAPREDLVKLCTTAVGQPCTWKLLRLVEHEDLAMDAKFHFVEVVNRLPKLDQE